MHKQCSVHSQLCREREGKRERERERETSKQQHHNKQKLGDKPDTIIYTLYMHLKFSCAKWPNLDVLSNTGAGGAAYTRWGLSDTRNLPPHLSKNLRRHLVTCSASSWPTSDIHTCTCILFHELCGTCMYMKEKLLITLISLWCTFSDRRTRAERMLLSSIL